MRTKYRPLWIVKIRHDFFGGDCDALEFIVPASSRRILAGARTIARVRDGQLVTLVEIGEDDRPIANEAAFVGRTLHFGLKPRSAHFEHFTAPNEVPSGQRVWWTNRDDAAALAGPRGLWLSGERLRIEPASAARPVDIRVLTPEGEVGAFLRVESGEEGRTLTDRLPAGEWLVEETVSGVTTTRTCLVDGELADSGCWGVLSLTVDAAHLDAGNDFTIGLPARVDRLRYYVVGDRFSATDLDEIEIRDGGFAAEGRPELRFRRVLPGAFGSEHLRPELLDASGGARIALFESSSALERRFRGPTRIELLRNGDVLVGHLPAPGADRPDAQFVVHLNKP